MSPALFEPIGEKFRKDIKDWARTNGIPVIRFTAGERKADVLAPYLEAATAAGRSQIVAVGCAQEFHRDAGYWWELSMRQIETSRTLVFDQDCHARAFFEALLCENMDLGRPENVELLFRRGERRGQPAKILPARGFRTAIDQHCAMVTLNVFYKNSRVKQYLNYLQP